MSGLAFDATCSLAVFDRSGDTVTVSTTGDDRWNVVMWADHRATAEAAAITATGHRSLRHVGGVMSPEMVPEAALAERHLPASWARIGLAFDLADALAWRACGRVAMSACTVTCKWAFLNHERPGWQQDLLDSIGLDDFRARTGLPDRPEPIGAKLGYLTGQAAAELGLPVECMVGAGLIDAHAGGLALLGALDGEALNQRLGADRRHLDLPYGGLAGSAVRAGRLGPLLGRDAAGSLAERGRPVRHRRPAGPRAGLACRGTGARRRTATGWSRSGLWRCWMRRGQGWPTGSGYCRTSTATARRLPTRRHGASSRALPSMLRSNSLARLYYAAAVGIALGTRHIVETLNTNGYAIQTLHLAGGHAASPLLPQLYADATGCTVVLREEADSILSGTASVAATAAGLHPSLSVCLGKTLSGTRRLPPRMEQAHHFKQEYAQFLRMVRATRQPS